MRWLLCSLALAVVPAQTFVVDPAGGAGANFTDLVVAIAAVPDGSTLLLRQGTYPPFTITGKSLTLVGVLGVAIGGMSSTPTVTVQGLAVGQRVVMRELASAINGGFRTTFLCQNCAGEILLEHVGGAGFSESCLVVSQCAQVVANRSVFANNPAAVSVTNSDVTLVDCGLVSGRNSVSGVPLSMQPAMVQVGGRVQLTECSLDPLGNPFQVNPPAVSMQGGVLRCDGGTWLRSVFSSVPGTVIVGTGTVRLDPSVVLSGTSPSVAPTILLANVDLPSLRAVGGAVGSSTDATMVGASGRLGVLWIGLPGPMVTLPGSGDPLAVWSGVVLSVGPLGTPLLASVNIPNQSTLVGAAFGWQGLAFDTAGAFELTNAVPFVLY